MDKDLLRQTIVAISAAAAIAGAFVGSGAAGGTPIEQAAGGALASDATLLAPGGPAFTIWSVIYLGLIGYAVWQCLPKQRTDERQRRIGYPVAASLILNAAWILSIQAGLLWLSVPVIVVLAAVLAYAFILTLRSRPGGLIETIVLDGTVGLYLGWVCVATAANVTAALVAAGFDGLGIPADAWALAVLAAVGAIGILVAFRGSGRVAPAMAIGWGLSWVAVARLTGDLPSTPTAIGALVVTVLVLAVTVTLRLRAGRSAGIPGQSA